MAKIWKNYIYFANTNRFKISDADIVYADQKMAVLDTETYVGEPLIVPINGVPTIVDRQTYESKNKLFTLSYNEKDGKVTEGTSGPKIVRMWYPKDTDISKLRWTPDHGIVLIENDETDKQPVKKVQAKDDSKSN